MPRTFDTFFAATRLLVILTGYPAAPTIRTNDGRVLKRSPVAVSESCCGTMTSTTDPRTATPGAYQFVLDADELPAEIDLVIETLDEPDQACRVRRRPHDPEIARLTEQLRRSLTRPASPTPPSTETPQ